MGGSAASKIHVHMKSNNILGDSRQAGMENTSGFHESDRFKLQIPVQFRRYIGRSVLDHARKTNAVVKRVAHFYKSPEK